MIQFYCSCLKNGRNICRDELGTNQYRKSPKWVSVYPIRHRYLRVELVNTGTKNIESQYRIYFGSGNSIPVRNQYPVPFAHPYHMYIFQH
ncbi:hypothetical protein HanIR_Chr17g0876391 [Helianthus annuus]|nr:hypothetical protein HanIR_Chr17g0876391 [Helianthus annuus]